MKVKFLSGPKSGTTEHINNQTGAVLIAAGLAIEVPMAPRGSAQWLTDMKERTAAYAEPQPAAQVTWLVAKGALTERYGITARCSRANCSSFFFDGHPDAWRDGHYLLEHLEFVHSCGAAAPVQVPESICKEYRRVKSTLENIPTVSADVANYHHLCHKSKGDGERVDVF